MNCIFGLCLYSRDCGHKDMPEFCSMHREFLEAKHKKEFKAFFENEEAKHRLGNKEGV